MNSVRRQTTCQQFYVRGNQKAPSGGNARKEAMAEKNRIGTRTVAGKRQHKEGQTLIKKGEHRQKGEHKVRLCGAGQRVHHSDQGVSYASGEYASLLKDSGIAISMGRKGNPYNNAKVESFIKTLKCEQVYLSEYDSLADAKAQIGHFVEAACNRKRLHSSLGYMPLPSSRKAITRTETRTRPSHLN